MDIDLTLPSPETASEANKCRERVLSKEFGEVIPAERIAPLLKDIRMLLDEAPEDSSKFADLFPGKEPVRFVIDGTNPSELFTVTLSRKHSKVGDRDEVRISRWFVDPVMEFSEKDGHLVDSPTKSAVRSDEMAFMMLGDPAAESTQIWVNLFQENAEENQRVNIEFIGECGINGVMPDQLEALTESDRKALGMFTNGEPLLAARELRQNPDDLTAMGILEHALKSGQKLTLEEMRARTQDLVNK